jgi:hypothetical protein
MGTRHLILVYYKGQYRICQYGQWDGQPDGQGLTCLHFLLNTQNIMDLRKVLDHSDNCIIVISDEERTAYFTDLQRQQRERGGNPFDFPGIESLSRDTGANILNVVAAATPEEPVKIHFWEMAFLTDEVHLEWAWVVDLDAKVLEGYTYWRRYKVLEEKSRFEDVLGSGKPLPDLVGRFRFDELPSGRGFLESFGALDMAEEEEEEEEE